MSLKNIIHPLVLAVRTAGDHTAHNRYLKTNWPEKIRLLYNTQEGRRCFIIGNGPSLKISDLDVLSGEDCFACNRIYGVYEKTLWRPKYYCVQDSRVIDQIKDDLMYALEQSRYTFLPYNFKEKYPVEMFENDRLHLFYHPYVSVYSRDGDYPEGIMPFSENIASAVYDGLSITYGMIQMAVYMGYREIYLIGVDHNYTMKNGKVDAERSYAEGIKPIDMSSQFPPELLLCEISFRGARKYCEAHGIKIRNATRGGKLEIFERIPLDSLFTLKTTTHD